MKVYSCVKFYASRFKDEPEPRWPVDDDFQEQMSQRGDGIDALEDAFPVRVVRLVICDGFSTIVTKI